MGSLLGKRWGRGGRTTSASWTNMESIRNYQINTLVSPIWGSSGLQRSSRGSSWRREKFPQLYVYMLLSGNSMLWLWWPLFYRFNIKWCERVFAFCFSYDFSMYWLFGTTKDVHKLHSMYVSVLCPTSMRDTTVLGSLWLILLYIMAYYTN